jgi:hypothetical protein
VTDHEKDRALIADLRSCEAAGDVVALERIRRAAIEHWQYIAASRARPRLAMRARAKAQTR